MNIGARVIRGPNWKWAVQDGGEGHLGTLVGLTDDKDGVEGVQVLWDNGSRNFYGATQNHYDIRLFDNSTAGVLHTCWCNACVESGKIKPVENENCISGIRWKCATCDDYDLCTQCYMKDVHPEHSFVRIVIPGAAWERMSLRTDSSKVAVHGFQLGAVVKRGRNWEWGDQDGGEGNVGKIVDILNYKSPLTKREYPNSFAKVVWEKKNDNNKYRIGYRGQVDLKCETSASGGYIYKDHLPVIGGPMYFLSWEYSLQDNLRIRVGDNVVVQETLKSFKEKQLEKNIWQDWHAKVVSFQRQKVMSVLNDKTVVEKLQSNHGGFDHEHEEFLGKLGHVINVDEDGDVLLKMGTSKVVWNRNCLRKSDTNLQEQLVQQSISSEEEELLYRLFLQLLTRDKKNKE